MTVPFFFAFNFFLWANRQNDSLSLIAPKVVECMKELEVTAFFTCSLLTEDGARVYYPIPPIPFLHHAAIIISSTIKKRSRYIMATL
jgi:hypothetical protein